MFISGSETTPSEGPKVARVGEHSAESAPALATGRDSGRGAGEHKRHRKYVNTLVGVVRTFQHFFTAQERHGAGGAVKKESETSAPRRLKFDTVGEDVAVAPERSAGVYGVTGRENPLAPLDS